MKERLFGRSAFCYTNTKCGLWRGDVCVKDNGESKWEMGNSSKSECLRGEPYTSRKGNQSMCMCSTEGIPVYNGEHSGWSDS